jgi:hypothetical protein
MTHRELDDIQQRCVDGDEAATKEEVAGLIRAARMRADDLAGYERAESAPSQ